MSLAQLSTLAHVYIYVLSLEEPFLSFFLCTSSPGVEEIFLVSALVEFHFEAKYFDSHVFATGYTGRSVASTITEYTRWHSFFLNLKLDCVTQDWNEGSERNALLL